MKLVATTPAGTKILRERERYYIQAIDYPAPVRITEGSARRIINLWRGVADVVWSVNDTWE